jgi:hypothetical protein
VIRAEVVRLSNAGAPWGGDRAPHPVCVEVSVDGYSVRVWVRGHATFWPVIHGAPAFAHSDPARTAEIERLARIAAAEALR